MEIGESEEFKRFREYLNTARAKPKHVSLQYVFPRGIVIIDNISCKYIWNINNNKMEIEKKLINYIETKGSFTLEERKDNNAKRGIFTFCCRNDTINEMMIKLLDQHEIKFYFINRKYKKKFENQVISYKLIRIANRPNLKKFLKLVDPYMEFKPENYDKVYNWTFNVKTQIYVCSVCKSTTQKKVSENCIIVYVKCPNKSCPRAFIGGMNLEE